MSHMKIDCFLITEKIFALFHPFDANDQKSKPALLSSGDNSGNSFSPRRCSNWKAFLLLNEALIEFLVTINSIDPILFLPLIK